MADPQKPYDPEAPWDPVAWKQEWEAANAPLSSAATATGQNAGLLSDYGTDIKRGLLQLPGAATGLADILVQGALGAPRAVLEGASALTGDDTYHQWSQAANQPWVSRGAEALGDVTGFDFGKRAERAQQEYSPERQAAKAEVEQAWKEGGAGNIAGAYLSNPLHTIGGLVAESLPATVAGGFLGRGIAALAQAPRVLAAAPTLSKYLSPVAAGGKGFAFGAGEGAVAAGMHMEQATEQGAPADITALTGLGVLGTTGALGVLGGKIANKMGIGDIEQAMAGAARGEAATTGLAGKLAEAAMQPTWAGRGTRVGFGALSEGLLEEAPQSAMEQVWQNVATGQDLTTDLTRSTVEGALAGAGMGGGYNAFTSGRPASEDMTAGAVPPGAGAAPKEDPLDRITPTGIDPGTVTWRSEPESTTVIDKGSVFDKVGYREITTTMSEDGSLLLRTITGKDGSVLGRAVYREKPEAPPTPAGAAPTPGAVPPVPPVTPEIDLTNPTPPTPGVNQDGKKANAVPAQGQSPAEGQGQAQSLRPEGANDDGQGGQGKETLLTPTPLPPAPTTGSGFQIVGKTGLLAGKVINTFNTQKDVDKYLKKWKVKADDVLIVPFGEAAKPPAPEVTTNALPVPGRPEANPAAPGKDPAAQAAAQATAERPPGAAPGAEVPTAEELTTDALQNTQAGASDADVRPPVGPQVGQDQGSDVSPAKSSGGVQPSGPESQAPAEVTTPKTDDELATAIRSRIGAAVSENKMRSVDTYVLDAIAAWAHSKINNGVYAPRNVRRGGKEGGKARGSQRVYVPDPEAPTTLSDAEFDAELRKNAPEGVKIPSIETLRKLRVAATNISSAERAALSAKYAALVSERRGENADTAEDAPLSALTPELGATRLDRSDAGAADQVVENANASKPTYGTKGLAGYTEGMTPEESAALKAQNEQLELQRLQLAQLTWERAQRFYSKAFGYAALPDWNELPESAVEDVKAAASAPDTKTTTALIKAVAAKHQRPRLPEAAAIKRAATEANAKPAPEPELDENGEPVAPAEEAPKAKAQVSTKKRRTIPTEGQPSEGAPTLTSTTLGAAQAVVDRLVGNNPAAKRRIVLAENVLDERVPPQAFEAAWLASKSGSQLRGWIQPTNGQQTIYLFYGSTPLRDVPAVLMHELTHASDAIMRRFAKRIKKFAASKTDSSERRIARAALQRVAEANTPRAAVDSEIIAYFVEEAIRAGIDPVTGAGATPQARSLLREMWRWLQGMLRKLGIYNTSHMQAGDIVALVHSLAQTATFGLEKHGAARAVVDGKAAVAARGQDEKAAEWGGVDRVVGVGEVRTGVPAVVRVLHGSPDSEFLENGEGFRILEDKSEKATFFSDKPSLTNQYAYRIPVRRDPTAAKRAQLVANTANAKLLKELGNAVYYGDETGTLAQRVRDAYRITDDEFAEAMRYSPKDELSSLHSAIVESVENAGGAEKIRAAQEVVRKLRNKYAEYLTGIDEDRKLYGKEPAVYATDLDAMLAVRRQFYELAFEGDDTLLDRAENDIKYTDLPILKTAAKAGLLPASVAAFNVAAAPIGGMYGVEDDSNPVTVISYVRMRNPLVINGEGREFRPATAHNAINDAKRGGYDGVVYRNLQDKGPSGNVLVYAAQIIVLDPDAQIKSAFAPFAGDGQFASIESGPNQPPVNLSPSSILADNWWEQSKAWTAEQTRGFWQRHGFALYTNPQLNRRHGTEGSRTVGTILDAITSAATRRIQEAAQLDNRWVQLPKVQADLVSRVLHEGRRLGFNPVNQDKEFAISSAEYKLQGQWRLLTPEAKAIHQAALDYYKNSLLAKKAILEEVREQVLKANKNAKLGEVDMVLKTFENAIASAEDAAKDGTYTPFIRVGDFHVIGMSPEMAALEAHREASQNDPVNNAWTPENTKRRDAMRQDPNHYVVQGATSVADMQKKHRALVAKFGKFGVQSMQNKVHSLMLSTASLTAISTYRATLEATQVQDAQGNTKSAMDAAAIDAAVFALQKMMIELLPEGHQLKRTLKAELVAGEEPDARAVFAQVARSDAHYMARLEHANELSEAMAKMQRVSNTIPAANAPGLTDDERTKILRDAEDAIAVSNEFARRANMTMSEPSPTANWLLNWSFFDHLGGSAAYILMNAHQPWTVTLPVLAARLQGHYETPEQAAKGIWVQRPVEDLKKTGEALWRHSKAAAKMLTFTKTGTAGQIATGQAEVRVSIDTAKLLEEAAKIQDPEERAKREQQIHFLEHLTRAQLLDITLEHNLGASADTRFQTLERVIRTIAMPPQAGEMINRAASGLAAFELGLEKFNGDVERATVFATEIVNDTQIDYSAGHTARAMRSVLGSQPLARIVFQFWKYRQGMLFLTFSSAKDWWDKNGGLDANAPEAEKEAARQAAKRSLAGLYATTMLTAGIFEGPLIAGGLGALSLLAGLGGDDDDPPVDFQRNIRNMMADVDPMLAEIASKGLYALLGIDMSKRLGMGDLANPLAFARFTGQSGRDDAAAALSAAAGAPFATVADTWDGVTKIARGDVREGIQQIVPLKGASDLMRAWGLGTEGLQTKTGEQIKGSESFSAADVIARAGGAQPLAMSRYYEGNAAVQAAKKAATEGRKTIIAEYAQARRRGQPSADAMQAVKDYNAKHPEKGLRITTETLLKAVQERAKIEKQRGDTGVLRSPQNKPFLPYGRFAEVE